jgi:C-terminal processing protease CtpA/Prc
MIRRTPLILAAAMLAAVAPAGFAKDKKPKRDRDILEPVRMVWMLGMHVGEDDEHPYPYVIELDPSGDAKAQGMRPGDELIRIGEQESRPLAILHSRVRNLPRRSMVTVWVRRGAEPHRFVFRVPKNPGPVEKKPQEEGAAEQPQDQTAASSGTEADSDKGKRKKKKKAPVVIKPIPAPSP